MAVDNFRRKAVRANQAQEELLVLLDGKIAPDVKAQLAEDARAAIAVWEEPPARVKGAAVREDSGPQLGQLTA